MRHKAFFAALALLLPQSALADESEATAPQQFVRLDDITAQEASAMLERLAAVQTELRAGRAQTLDIMAGGWASSVAASRPARQQLIDLPLDQALFAAQLEDTPDGRPQYRFSVFPDGMGRVYWQVDVVCTGWGEIVLVTMISRIPPPF